MTRRNFLWLGWTFFLSFLSGVLATVGRYMIPNVLYESSQVFKIGIPSDYSVGISTKWMSVQRIWIVKTQNSMYALWAKCTHLGCTPSWVSVEKRFKCPCHGSNFDVEGDVIAGPAPKPLNRCAITRLPNGEILVDKSILESRALFRTQEQFLISVA